MVVRLLLFQEEHVADNYCSELNHCLYHHGSYQPEMMVVTCKLCHDQRDALLSCLMGDVGPLAEVLDKVVLNAKFVYILNMCVKVNVQ